MPPAAPPPTTQHGILATEQHHRETMKDRLMRIIDDALGIALTFPEGYKPSLKNDNVTKYSGSPKYNDIEQWLVIVVHRYALLKLGGSSATTDRVRLLTLLEYLEGTALTWFNNHVLNSKRTIVHWTFCEAIMALYDRFVLPSMMHEARESFRSVKYTTQLGVQGFYDELVQRGSNMAVYPDQHTMLEEFLKGIPYDMRTRCFKEFGLNPESNDMDDFVSTALRIEHGNRVDAYYNTIAHAKVTVSTGGAKVKPSAIKHPAERYESKLKPRVGFQKTYGNHREKPRAFTPKATDRTGAHSAPKTTQVVPYKRNNAAKPDKASSECFKCGIIGHFASECKNEPKKKAFLRAAHTVVAPSEESDADDENSSLRNESRFEAETNAEYYDHDDPQEIEVAASDLYEDHGQEDYDSDFIHSMDVVPTERDDELSLTGKPPSTVQSIPRLAAVKENALSSAQDEQNTTKKKFKFLSSGRTRMRPTVPPEDKECLATWVKVGNLEAWALWDSGSTTTGITPAFAEHAKVVIDTLEDPHTLQLGTVGSRSSIKYGADVNIQVAKVNATSYVDIANFDRYDMIVGTPWMKRNKVLLDFEKNQVVIDGTPVDAIKIREKDLDPRIRRYRTTDKKNKDE